jgi:hypothetical protein
MRILSFISHSIGGIQDEAKVYIGGAAYYRSAGVLGMS